MIAKQVPAPFKPPMKDEKDTSNFEALHTRFEWSLWATLVSSEEYENYTRLEWRLSDYTSFKWSLPGYTRFECIFQTCPESTELPPAVPAAADPFVDW